jgi:hypothetical protein
LALSNSQETACRRDARPETTRRHCRQRDPRRQASDQEIEEDTDDSGKDKGAQVLGGKGGGAWWDKLTAERRGRDRQEGCAEEMELEIGLTC